MNFKINFSQIISLASTALAAGFFWSCVPQGGQVVHVKGEHHHDHAHEGAEHSDAEGADHDHEHDEDHDHEGEAQDLTTGKCIVKNLDHPNAITPAPTDRLVVEKIEEARVAEVSKTAKVVDCSTVANLQTKG